MLSIVILSVVMLSVVMLCAIMLSVVMLSVIMLSVIMLSVVMLSVVAPLILLSCICWFFVVSEEKNFFAKFFVSPILCFVEDFNFFGKLFWRK